MAYRDLEVRKQRDRERYHRPVAERRPAGLCAKCGRCPPAPGRSICGACAEKARASGRARDARLRAAGKPRRDPGRAREYERERSRRQAEARRDAGQCVRCGTAPAAGGRSSCEPCLAKKREADRIRYHEAKHAGLKYGGKAVAVKRKAGRIASKRRQENRHDSGCMYELQTPSARRGRRDLRALPHRATAGGPRALCRPEIRRVVREMLRLDD